MKWIRIFAIPIIIIIIITIALLLFMSNEKKKFYSGLPQYIEQTTDGTKIMTKPLNTSMYYTITESCNNIMKYAREGNAVAVFNLLNSNYKTNNNITVNNVLEITKLNSAKLYKTLKIYRASGTQYAEYFIQGITENGYIYFNIDEYVPKSTFNFSIISEEEFNRYINMEVPIYKEIIVKNKYNELPDIRYSNLKVAEMYFLDYIENAILFPQIAYNSLEKEFREEKYGSLQDYVNYISNNEQIKSIYVSNFLNTDEITDYTKKIGLKSYTEEEKDGFIEYVFEDTYGNIYTYKVKSVMQYTLTINDNNISNSVR